jgi:carbon dioxide concentrating mechanism protein CcmN
MSGLVPIRPVVHSEVYVSGNVTIDEGAVIAPGVILQASLDSGIIIRSGACLGMGTILNAFGGFIEINSGAILGAGVLLVGRVLIGTNACIGSCTTIFNSSIEPSALILAGSLIEGLGLIDSPDISAEDVLQELPVDPWVEEIPNDLVAENQIENLTEDSKSSVVGQVYINQLLVTLFPARQSTNKTENL